MPVTHLVVRDASGRRTARRIRRAALLVAVVGMMTGAGLAAAGLAQAASSAQQGNLILSPASGATTVTPTWSTTDGCPSGYQGSAEMSEFKPDGALASRISPVLNTGLTTAFKGTLDGNIGALLRVTHIKNGGTIKFAIGCYSLEGGTGKVTWDQSAMVTLSTAGTAYTTRSSRTAAAGSASSTSTQVETALIAAACVLGVAVALIAWSRRRNLSQLT